MKTENRYTFLHMIYDELEKAEKKHPKFCDHMTTYTLFESLVAYKEGDKEHCLQELAQCGAVILRMMDFVKEQK